MSWKEFLQLNGKKILITILLLLIIPNIIEFLGTYVNNVVFPRDYTKPPGFEITLGGPPLWVITLSTLSLVGTSIALTVYFFKKGLSYNDIFKIILISAILFSGINFIRFLIEISMNPLLNLNGGIIGYFSGMGIYDIVSFIFYRLIRTPLFYIIIPSIVILGIDKYFYKIKK